MGRVRDGSGRWLQGQSGNPKGRLPREREHKFLDVTLSAVTEDDWKVIIEKAVEQARGGDSVARKFLGEYLLGQPAQVHEYLVNEQRDFTIRVVFGELPAPEYEVIEGEVVS